jgi:predicted nucleic acid-binding protein
MVVAITPFRERLPLLAAPQVLWDLWRHRRRNAA